MCVYVMALMHYSSTSQVLEVDQRVEQIKLRGAVAAETENVNLNDGDGIDGSIGSEEKSVS